ncbi:hypothetical protein [Arsenicibacter rosenii]|uniref:Uncharacterized protein n=1 Tax=Arsenicibacter rosenii TaxID=1750698 RepID=A0A1S2VRR5_9BACT|nr:hypothetical protein [Arsenicibacter rosenii]OIN61180.1 hypothetical protein BLX24_03730 [Arsenicibacter rosenii]
MNEQERQEQIIRQKAKIRSLERQSAKPSELEQARAFLTALTTRKAEPDAPVQNVVPEKKQAQLPLEQLPKQVQEHIEQLTGARNQIHAEKAKLCNSLHTYPDSVNCKQVVKEILAYRQKWKLLQDDIRLTMQLGVIPVVGPEKAEPGTDITKLTADPEKLRYKIQCLQSNIRKAEKRRAQAKEELTKRRNELAIAKWTAEISQLKTRLATL